MREIEEKRLEKLNKKKWKWIEKRLNKDPEYRDIMARIESHEAKKDSLESGLTEAEWRQIQTNLDYQKEEITQSSELLLDTLKAWWRKQEKRN